ncbi:MAG: transcriptional regulator, partial [Alloprevotella sp.]|nr:transcriptional regulator [Alloprevotella sp.]
MQLQDDGRTLFETDVCSFLGIGRFVLGLLDDIEVVGSKEFRTYLAKRLDTMKTRFEETQKKKKKSQSE